MNIKVVLFASPLSVQHEGENAKTGWLRIGIMYLSGATCLTAVFFQRASTIKIQLRLVGLVQSKPHHHLIEN